MSVGQQTDTADILDSTAEDGEVRCSLGDYITDFGYSTDNPMWGPDGFIARPNDPTDDGACQAFYVQDANDRRIVATNDPRFTEQVGELEPGDRAIVTDGPPRVLVKQESQSVTLYTENMNDETMMVSLDGLEGVISLLAGTSWIKMTAEKITLGVSGGGQVVIDKSGVTVAGGQFVAATLGGCLGIIGVPPTATVPMQPAQSILYGPVGPAGVPSLNWTVVP